MNNNNSDQKNYLRIQLLSHFSLIRVIFTDKNEETARNKM